MLPNPRLCRAGLVPLVLFAACRAADTPADSAARAPSAHSDAADYPAITIDGTAYETAMRVTLPPEKPEEFDGLHNVFHLSPEIISGSEPHGEAAFEEIRDMGVKTIISVDGKVPDAQAAAALGMRYVHIPTQYKGFTKEELALLTKTYRELEGPFYVHCFHGKHRGPAAAAIGRIVVDGVGRQTAIAEMRQYCGTSPSYEGLYRDVATAYIPDADQTATLDFDFPSQKLPRGVTSAMVEISRVNDNLEALSKRAFAVDPEHPDVDPRNEAEKMLQAFDAALGFDEVMNGPEDYRGWFEDARNGSKSLLDALGRMKQGEAGAAEDAAKSWTAVKESCTACHKVYRN